MVKADMDSVLLMGPPNIGKSVIFNALTGINVSMANYVGTTVEYTKGVMTLNNRELILIDVPGTYTLDATNDAEKVAVDMLKGNLVEKNGKSCHRASQNNSETLKSPSAVISVIDSCNLESSLYLLFQVLEYGIPTIAVLNRMDILEERGDIINIPLLEKELGIKVIPTVAIEKKGIKELKEELGNLLNEVIKKNLKATIKPEKSKNESKNDEIWEKAELLSKKVMNKIENRKKSKREVFGELLTKPWPGLPISILILGISFGIIIGFGMGLRKYILLPIVRGLIIPEIERLINLILSDGMIKNIFIGDYGFLVKGLEWPFTLVFPYVISFYLALSLLEDSGYLPRLGVLLDGLLNKMGLPGASIIPLLLGYGCGIPAIMSTRSLNTNKERILASTLICLSIPCIAQSGAFISLLAERSIIALFLVYAFSLVLLISSGLLLNKLLPGKRHPTIMEIPELLIPKKEVILKKVWLRANQFLKEGALPMMGMIGLAALLYESGIMDIIGRLMSPLVVGILKLPAEASVPLILGIFRREFSIIPLIEMELTTIQLFTGAIVGLLYVPCIAIIALLAREFNLKVSIMVTLLTTISAFVIGGFIANFGSLLIR
ncbi:GTP-binding protein HSR1-related [Methanococcus vannielii SB]|uniref:GTP-binding protein HSR1-related n=1 Tax=Methanococcus vannielii (strain ATCC 35089 / DSM 1224 / JCM 13029 / OCM 148 / SB) TaxID=406327 RepID=A6URH0_METVS|nr:ferrous iron transporter B [Methanococcus vannielii]ABR55092.1 GTP-binding protein HSR1-related [Methanococcus vannielii SB]